MASWTSEELARIGTAEELEIAPVRDDGTPRAPVPIWVVRDGDDLYIRSYRGTDGAWYRTARAGHRAHIAAGGIDKDVTLAEENDSGVNDRIDEAYRAKYHRYGSTYVIPMVAAQARATTLKLLPRP
ncbi:DUF2255 family protein [Nonomuraea angiospora]|uniref:DUF2255 family protein n=1 Tax=Nonomuraea angiospora TaxID=46172 RepID=A0ABR9LMT9_9ACTN|nr:DUF2255 family protein [Nonomuraea angiospora]MBE1581974.1 hypothetical protein [Nonomuraea angiospora]MDX3107838.1 DUF2255 family protein [Nonomuraea angiospora]